MLSKALAVIGLILFLIGVSLLLLFGRSQVYARGQDAVGPRPVETPCGRLLSDVFLSDRVMTERESQALNVTLVNGSGVVDCPVTVSLLAPNFDLAPPTAERNVVVPVSGEPLVLAWILSPRRTGSFEIVVTTDFESQTLGIVVTTVLGLTAGQAQVLSVLATFLGPMLTAPWWYEQWEKRRKERQKQARPPEQPAPPAGYKPE
ncbi:MAG: hypothetical protein L0332_15985 [Chloroflexi bacterium]|nr:hypothetical protein [Chloroflexota bacterium]MCI0580606.1 hypothetical protein [Chloroflexota bacterium]MCI0648872.1 hypothetical protein [Chloroflexota bacterium]MCI0728202.1 hypothetical protein [Chloroflexota bacterium]